MNFKELTVELLDSFLTDPTAKEVKISMDLCTGLFDVMKLMTWFYGPSMTYEKLKNIYEAK